MKRVDELKEIIKNKETNNDEYNIEVVQTDKGFVLYSLVYVTDVFGFLARRPERIGIIRYNSEVQKWLFNPRWNCKFSYGLIKAVEKVMLNKNLK